MFNYDTEAAYYMFPIFESNECIGMIHMSQDLNVGVTRTTDTMPYDKILTLPTGDYILYVTGGMLYAESSDEIVLLQDLGFSLPINDDYLSIPYEEKVEIFTFQTEGTCNLLDVYTPQETVFDVVVENDRRASTVQPYVLVPEFEFETCGITNFVSQGNYNLCWAACVATIANYKNGSNLSAIDVAKKIGADYTNKNYAGENAITTTAVLNSYGFSYSVQGRLGWNAVKNSIRTKYPFIIGATTSVGIYTVGHMVVAYGYECAYGDSLDDSDSRYIYFWNPGSSVRFSFQYNKSTFSYNGYTWTWLESVSK